METGTNKIRIVIAEDEQPIRQLLQSYLSSFPQVSVIAAVGNGREVLELLEQAKPTAVLLDIEMPEFNGLSLAARLRVQQPELFTVFVTAHAEYAAEAYQVEAVDYLIKPVTREALARAIGRIERFSALKKDRDVSRRLTEDRLAVKNGHEIYFIKMHEIFFIETASKRAIVHTVSGKYPTTESLNALQMRLDHHFFRCHKSYIVNLQRIEKIVPLAERVYQISFYNYPHSVTMRRQKFEELSNAWLLPSNKLE